MPKQRSITSFVAEIMSINRQLRQLKNKGRVASRLRTAKDDLMNEMAALCHHPAVIAMPDVPARGPKPPVSARRFCTRCGHCESQRSDGNFGALQAATAMLLSVEDYVIRQGLVLRRLGINCDL